MKGRKILVVEDEAFIAHDIKQVLEGEGYTMIIDCFNVDMALDMLPIHQPDLVLIDINLNDSKNGMDLAQYLDTVAKLPYIFITSYVDKGTLSKVAELSSSGYITKPFKPQDLISSVYLVMRKIVAQQDTADTGNGVPFAITQVQDYIHQHLREKLDLEMLAGMTKWESEHFGRLFKEYVGMTPYQYILKERIELSKKLLSQPGELSQSICYEVGFTNYSNFYNAFRKHLGISPEQFRKIAMKENKQ